MVEHNDEQVHEISLASFTIPGKWKQHVVSSAT